MKRAIASKCVLYIFFILYIIFGHSVKMFFLHASQTKQIIDYMMIISVVVCELILIASFLKNIVFRNRTYGIRNVIIKCSFMFLLTIIAFLFSCYTLIVYKYIDLIVNKLAYMFNLVYSCIQGLLSNTIDMKVIAFNNQHLTIIVSFIILILLTKAVVVCIKHINSLKKEQKQSITFAPHIEYYESEVNYLLSVQSFGHLYKTIP